MGETRDKKVFDRVYNEPTGNGGDLTRINKSIGHFALKLELGLYDNEKQRLHYLNLIYEYEKKRKKQMQILGLLPVRKKVIDRAVRYWY